MDIVLNIAFSLPTFKIFTVQKTTHLSVRTVITYTLNQSNIISIIRGKNKNGQ